MVPQAGVFPPELTALRAAGLIAAVAIVAYAVARRRSLRNVDVLILLAAGTRAGDRLRHRADRQAALRLLLPEGQRRADPRPRGLRDLRPLPACPAIAFAGRPQLPPALRGARGAGLGGVPPGRPPGPLSRQDRDRRPRLQRGRERRPRARPDAGRGLRRADRGARRRRRLARRHRRRGGEARRGCRPPRDQPRRRRGSAHRLPADGRLRRRDRRHPRRRRPAPALGDGAPGQAGARRRGRRRPRLARPRPAPTATTSPASWASSSSTGSSP